MPGPVPTNPRFTPRQSRSQQGANYTLLKEIMGRRPHWDEVEDNNNILFDDEQITSLKALGSFVNHNQNRLGPLEGEHKMKFNFMDATFLLMRILP